MSDPRRAYSASVTVSLEASEDDDDDKEERMATMETTHDETEAAYASSNQASGWTTTWSDSRYDFQKKNKLLFLSK